MTNPLDVQYYVSTKMSELVVEWMDIPATQKLIRRLISLANGGMFVEYICIISVM